MYITVMPEVTDDLSNTKVLSQYPDCYADLLRAPTTCLSVCVSVCVCLYIYIYIYTSVLP